MASTHNGQPMLDVTGLTVEVEVDGQNLTAVNDVSFSLRAGETRGLVGESGSGKSLTLRAITGLLPSNAHVTAGRLLVDGTEYDLAAGGRHSARALAQLRGSTISMIFQEPAVALNPVIPVGEQIVDAAIHERRMNRKQAREYAVHLMERAGIDDASTRADAYPFELSGGLQQRVMIASAVARDPKIVLCDEPTTALDVTVQRKILELFTELRDELGVGLVYVTHDLAVVAQLCDSLTVLYGGNVMESSDDLTSILSEPRHPYTEALLRSTPDIDRISRRLYSIPGSAPSLGDRPTGCPFAPRCEYRQDDCVVGQIPDTSHIPGRIVHCLHQVGSIGPDLGKRRPPAQRVQESAE